MGREKVGYGRPPKANQFKPGKSGNPKGRPKGSLNLVNDLAAELSELITVREDGRARRISKQRALSNRFWPREYRVRYVQPQQFLRSMRASMSKESTTKIQSMTRNWPS